MLWSAGNETDCYTATRPVTVSSVPSDKFAALSKGLNFEYFFLGRLARTPGTCDFLLLPFLPPFLLIVSTAANVLAGAGNFDPYSIAS